MAKFEQKLSKEDWIAVDPTTLSPAQFTVYEALRAARRLAAEAREAFETTMQPMAPQGQRLVFGYNFGKLSIAMVAGEAKAKAEAKPAMSLAQFLANKAAMGDRS